MYSKELLQPADLQPYINQPETLINQTFEFQLTVANYLQTPIELLEILVNQSCYPQVVETVKLHVTYIKLTGEIRDNWREIAEDKIKNAPLQQNDRLVAELLKIAPVPEYLISEWIPGHRLIQGLENPYLSKQDKVRLLERLGKSIIIEERLTAAVHPDTPRGTLEILAGDLELPIRIAVKYRDDDFDDAIAILESQHQVASDWETLALELIELARSKWSWVRQTVARNFNAPVEVLRELAGDEEEKVQLAVARNLATPGEVLDLLVSHGWGEVTESIAKHPNASEDALIKLLPRYEDFIEGRIKPIDNLPQPLKLIQNIDTPSSVLEKIDLNDCPSHFKQKLARHPNVSRKLLEKLSEEKSPVIRLAVFQNIKTPEYIRNIILEELLDFKNKQYKYDKEDYFIYFKDIWIGLANSETTPSDVLTKLAYDISYSGSVCIALLINSNTPEHVRQKLLQKLLSLPESEKSYSDWQIYLAIAFNSSITENERQEYFEKAINLSWEAQRILAKHPKTPSDILEQLANTTYININYVAENPSTPAHVLRKLIKHASDDVRQCVVKNPSTPPDILIELINQPYFKFGHFAYGNYEQFSKLAYEYPNFPKKELYRVLLDKEISEQNQKARGFIEENCNNIKQFKDYISKNKDTQTYNYRSVKPDIRPEYFLPKKISPTLKRLTRLYKPNDNLPTLLSEYVQSQTPFVRFISLIHPLIPIEFLQQNSQSLLWWERYAVAINSATPLEIRERLTEDCNYIVKAAAQDSLKNDLYL